MGRKREQWPKAEFGACLRRAREAAGLSQQALAVRAGVSVFAVSKIEQGAVEPSWPMACALADALGAGLGEFREAEPKKPPDGE